MQLEVGAPPSPSPIFGGFADIVASLEPTPAPFPSGTNISMVIASAMSSASSSSSSSPNYILGISISIGVLATVAVGAVIWKRHRDSYHYQSIPTQPTEIEA